MVPSACAFRVAQDMDKALKVVTPELGEVYALKAGDQAKRLKTARAEAAECCGRDWQNEYADFSVNLKRELSSIKDAEARKRALAEMRKVLDNYASFREERKARNGG